MFHIKQVPEDHELWKLADTIVLDCIWNKDTEDDEYVSAVGACCDFLYGISDKGRLRLTGTPMHVAGRFGDIIAHDKFVRELINQAARQYTYYTVEEGSDVDMNALCVSKLYHKLMEAGNIAFYEEQAVVVTTNKIEL